MNYLLFCQRFAEATGLPLTLLKEGKPVYSSLHPQGVLPQDAQYDMWQTSRNPEFLAQSANLEYGRVRIEGTDFDIILGPLFATPVTEEIVAEFLSDEQTPRESREQMAEMLYGLPLISHPQCLRYLMFLHLCLNHKQVEAEDFYAEASDTVLSRSKQELDTSIEIQEAETYRSSYTFEMQLYHYIEMGDVSKLKAFLESIREFPHEGRMAKSPLRHAKNILIGVGSKAIVMGAIPGGMNAEKAYQLMDLYAVECEQLLTIEEVHRLQYIMLMDFCQRTGNARMPANLSPEVYRCVTYIRNHTNKPLSVDEVAAQVGRSRSYLMRHFKEEMGLSINAFITQCKLEDACDMLTYGSASLSQISAYLGYSTQSYFQNVFKKAYGLTPQQFRQKNRKG